MNAQLLVLLTDLRDSRALRLYGDAYMPRIEASIKHLQAALAAPKEAGDAELNYTQQVYALARRCLWLAFAWNDHNFDAANIEARREAERFGITSFDGANEWLEHEISVANPTNAELAAPQADQQGASLEGEPPRGWGIAGNYGDGKWRCFREGKPQTYLGNPQATRANALAECHRLAALSKASPDDQRQEGERFDVVWVVRGPSGSTVGVCRPRTEWPEWVRAHDRDIGVPFPTSPPTEAAAAVGDGYMREVLARLAQAVRERVGSTVLISKADACAIGAALSPTASAAREGSNG